MATRWTGVFIVSALGLLSVVSTAQQPAPSSGAPIRLRAGTFTPARGEALSVPSDLAGAPARAGVRGEFLVQFAGPVQDQWKAALASGGADVLEYVPDFAFRVRATPDVAARLRQLPFVSWVGPYQPAYKLQPGLAGTPEGLFIVRVEPGADASAVEAALAAAGTRVSRRGDRLLLVRGDAARLALVAGTAGVAGVERLALRVRHNEYGGGVIMGARTAHLAGFDGSTQVVAISDTGLGHGTAAGAHPDLPASRVAGIFNWPGTPDECFEIIVNDGAADVDTGHGTHVATTAVGGGNHNGVGRGTAPSSGLVFQAIENYAIPSLFCSILYGVPEAYYLVGIPGDVGDLFEQAHDAGARVHSNSWGSAVAGAYTTDSENADAFVWARRDMTVVFSAGNSGTDANADGVIDPTSIGSPGTAKNVITVGASENDRQSRWDCDPGLTYTTCAAQGGQNVAFTWGATWPTRYPVNPLRDDASAGNAEQMAAFSSRGPTEDGRIKPDVVAPGTWTLSGYADLYQQQYDGSANPQTGAYQYDGWGFPLDQYYKYLGGTSMSAPLVAGGAAVVRDYYQKVLGHQASAALVKATLINSAVDLLDENNDNVFDNAYPIPNIHEGWGRVDLANATDGSHTFVDESTALTTGTNASFTVPVESAGTPLKVSLVWTDFPSSSTAAVNLVNDLDLTVIAPDGTTYLGNVFTGGWSAPGGAPDRLNNVENVYLFAAGAGTWTVVVSGHNVPSGPQPFALVVDNPSQTGSGLPVVRVLAEDATATEVGPTGGVLRFTRSGDTADPLTIFYTVSGTATPDVDYAALSGSVTIPEGATDAFVPVQALDDVLVESTETVVVTLASDATYTIGSPASGIVSIASDDLPPDLVVSTLSAPAYVAAGASITVMDTTRNQGTTSATASETGFYLSTNSVLDANDVFVAGRPVPALAAGTADLASTTIAIPEDTVPGTYYLLAKADWSGAVSESNESNNIRSSGAVRVGPDLLVTVLTAPPTAAAGQEVSVTATVKNQGAGPSDESVTAYYLSLNSSWDTGDVFLGTRSVPALAGGLTDIGPAVLTLPEATAVGVYYIIARADSAATVAEYAENNNVRASGAVRVGVDLTVTALTGPTAAAPGDTITMNETTSNIGGGDGPASTTVFYLSVNTSLDGADTMLASRAVPELTAGASHATTVSLDLPAGLAVGTYYVIAKADGTSQVFETNENNNVRPSGALKVGPDLSFTALAIPSNGGAGEPISVSSTVKNIGGAATPPTEVAFYLSSNSSVDASDHELGRRAVSALAPGASDAATVVVVLPGDVATASYYVLAVVDPDLTVAELLETNNLRVSSLLRVGPDLVVSALTGPTSGVRGATVSFTDTTRNQGGGAAPGSVTQLYLSTNSTLDAADVPLGTRTVAALGPLASASGATAVTVPTTVGTGNFYVIARSDDPNAIVETAENNNVRVKSFRIN
jgi:subtilase family serine protease